MKKPVSIVLLCAFVLLSCKIQNPIYEIHATIGATEKPAKAFFVYQDEAGEIVIDSAQVENGEFKFLGDYSGPFQATIVVNHQGNKPFSWGLRDRIDLLVEQGKITLRSPDSIKNATISGSLLNDLSKEYDRLTKLFRDEIAELQTEYAFASEEQKNTREFQQEINDKWREIEEREKKAAYDYLNEHRDSYISLLKALPTYLGYNPDIETLEAALSLLSPDVRNTVSGKYYEKKLKTLQATALGVLAPEFTQSDTTGNPVSLSDFRGKYVLLDFWASWCSPCRHENPFVVAAFEKYKDKNFTILGVSLDESKEDWLKAIEDDNLTWTQVSDLKGWRNGASSLYGVNGIPANYFLDPNGKIIEKNLRGDQLTEALEKYLN